MNSQKSEVDKGGENFLPELKHLVLVQPQMLQGCQVVKAAWLQTHDLVVVQVPVRERFYVNAF